MMTTAPPQYGVIAASFFGGIVTAGLFSIWKLDIGNIVQGNWLAVVGGALAIGTVCMFIGTLAGLSFKLALEAILNMDRGWIEASIVSFTAASIIAIIIIKWLIAIGLLS